MRKRVGVSYAGGWHMRDVSEVQRHVSPGGRPQPLAFHGQTLWLGCWDSSHLYAVDPRTWALLDEVAAPGKPFGLASFGGALRVVVSMGEEDDRFLFRFVPGHGFDLDSKTACPELTGSHLTANGSTLYLLQATNQRILGLSSDGSVTREIALPSRCAGIGWGAGELYMIAADEEFEDLRLATLDVEAEHPKPVPMAHLSDEARGLAFDGTAWWTSHREANEIVAFIIAADGA